VHIDELAPDMGQAGNLAYLTGSLELLKSDIADVRRHRFVDTVLTRARNAKSLPRGRLLNV